MKTDKRCIEIYDTPEKVCHAAAEKFTRIANDSIKVHGRFTVALAGGSTPKRLYELLALEPYNGQIEWPKVHFFWGDERAVPPDHPDSNFRMTYNALLGKLDIPQDHIHRMPSDRKNRDQAAMDYQREIAETFNSSSDGEPPCFDLILLGMGNDGHTASLFPHTEALAESTRWVVANYIALLDTWRMTFTSGLINHAKHILILVTGSKKAKALEQVLHGPQNPDLLPSQLIKPLDGDLLWLIDKTANANKALTRSTYLER